MSTNTELSTLNPIKELLPQVARKIAAGEVIDRPQAVVRELLDNAIDAKSTQVIVEVEQGGTGKIRIKDNGLGMTKADLELCWKPHTTSKISEAEDLLSLSTLGFRGEALSSICSVSGMKITSKRKNLTAYSLETNLVYSCADSDNREKHGEKVSWSIKPASLDNGTIIEITNLFENFPARKAFIKNERTEAQLCKQAFIDKALPWPKVAFSYSQDGQLKANYPENQTYLERCLSVFKPQEPEIFFKTVTGKGEGFSFCCVLGTREVLRKDKRNMMVFINGRKVTEYSLVQAMDYGAEGCFPNGSHPFSVLFLNIDSNLIDFNIHPAKKEVRIKNIQAIHRAVSQATRSFYHQNLLKNLYEENQEIEQTMTSKQSILSEFTFDEQPKYTTTSFEKPSNNIEQNTTSEIQTQKPTKNVSKGFKYIGQAMNLFLIVEKDEAIYLIDQHAAHERIIFNELQKRKTEKQELLIPYFIRTKEKSQDAFLKSIVPSLFENGFEIEQTDDFLWQVTAIPTRYKGTEKDLQEDLLTKATSNAPILYSVLARAACRQAVKQGDPLERSAAEELAQQALELPEPYCPHGRPIWIKMTKDALCNLIERT